MGYNAATSAVYWSVKSNALMKDCEWKKEASAKREGKREGKIISSRNWDDDPKGTGKQGEGGG